MAPPVKVLDDPTSLGERNQVARSCADALSLTLPMVVDDMSDSVSQAYHAWPERLYVVGSDGKIAYKGGVGPMFFDPMEAARALRAEIAKAKKD